jgi:hypothetical protein
MDSVATRLVREEQVAQALEEHVRWLTDTLHRTHHHDNGQDAKTWREDCPKTTCAGSRRVLQEAERIRKGQR